MYALQNLRGRIDHIKQWLDTQGKGSALSEADLRVYEMISEAETVEAKGFGAKGEIE